MVGIVDVSFDLMSPHDVIGLNSLRSRNVPYCAQLVAVFFPYTSCITKQIIYAQLLTLRSLQRIRAAL